MPINRSSPSPGGLREQSLYHGGNDGPLEDTRRGAEVFGGGWVAVRGTSWCLKFESLIGQFLAKGCRICQSKINIGTCFSSSVWLLLLPGPGAPGLSANGHFLWQRNPQFLQQETPMWSTTAAVQLARTNLKPIATTGRNFRLKIVKHACSWFSRGSKVFLCEMIHGSQWTWNRWIDMNSSLLG